MSGRLFLALALILAALDYFVPFHMLKDIDNFFGCYLFWSALTFMVIISGIITVNKTWGKKQ